jgi:hypothetical protein
MSVQSLTRLLIIIALAIVALLLVRLHSASEPRRDWRQSSAQGATILPWTADSPQVVSAFSSPRDALPS